MAHRARVLQGERTIRFHYANCATFNADFDGDEINLHLPQEQQGRAEGVHIVHADHQFMVRCCSMILCLHTLCSLGMKYFAQLKWTLRCCVAALCCTGLQYAALLPLLPHFVAAGAPGTGAPTLQHAAGACVLPIHAEC
jgi:DNA-directed RNA polymerase beta' subunit